MMGKDFFFLTASCVASLLLGAGLGLLARTISRQPALVEIPSLHCTCTCDDGIAVLEILSENDEGEWAEP